MHLWKYNLIWYFNYVSYPDSQNFGIFWVFISGSPGFWDFLLGIFRDFQMTIPIPGTFDPKGFGIPKKSNYEANSVYICFEPYYDHTSCICFFSRTNSDWTYQFLKGFVHFPNFEALEANFGYIFGPMINFNN